MSYDHLPEVQEFNDLQKQLKEIEGKIKECTLRTIEAVCKFKVGQVVFWLEPKGRRKKPMLVEIKSRSMGKESFEPFYKIQTVKSGAKFQKELAFGYGYLPESQFSESTEFMNVKPAT